MEESFQKFGHAILAHRDPVDPSTWILRIDALAGRRELSASFLDLLHQMPRNSFDPLAKQIALDSLKNPGSVRAACRNLTNNPKDAERLRDRVRNIQDFLLGRNAYRPRVRKRAANSQQSLRAPRGSQSKAKDEQRRNWFIERSNEKDTQQFGDNEDRSD